MVKLVAVELVSITRFQEISTRVGLTLTVCFPVLGPRVFRINAVVLGSNDGISIFSGIVLTVEFILNIFNLIQGIMRNNPSLSSITDSSVRVPGAHRNNAMVLGSNPEFGICT